MDERSASRFFKFIEVRSSQVIVLRFGYCHYCNTCIHLSLGNGKMLCLNYSSTKKLASPLSANRLKYSWSDRGG